MQRDMYMKLTRWYRHNKGAFVKHKFIARDFLIRYPRSDATWNMTTMKYVISREREKLLYSTWQIMTNSRSLHVWQVVAETNLLRSKSIRISDKYAILTNATWTINSQGTWLKLSMLFLYVFKTYI